MPLPCCRTLPRLTGGPYGRQGAGGGRRLPPPRRGLSPAALCIAPRDTAPCHSRHAGPGRPHRLQEPARRLLHLFQAVSETLRTIAADPAHLGVEIGFRAVLHYRGLCTASFPGGGIAPLGDRWIACRAGFFSRSGCCHGCSAGGPWRFLYSCTTLSARKSAAARRGRSRAPGGGRPRRNRAPPPALPRPICAQPQAISRRFWDLPPSRRRRSPAPKPDTRPAERRIQGLRIAQSLCGAALAFAPVFGWVDRSRTRPHPWFATYATRPSGGRAWCGCSPSNTQPHSARPHSERASAPPNRMGTKSQAVPGRLPCVPAARQGRRR